MGTRAGHVCVKSREGIQGGEVVRSWPLLITTPGPSEAHQEELLVDKAALPQDLRCPSAAGSQSLFIRNSLKGTD